MHPHFLAATVFTTFRPPPLVYHIKIILGHPLLSSLVLLRMTFLALIFPCHSINFFCSYSLGLRHDEMLTSRLWTRRI